ncbi:MAG: hypothetical protein RMN24_09175, partial [Anaerolineae bacterium]|nr:hypothetical protein [Anaerolineae bacterium]
MTQIPDEPQPSADAAAIETHIAASAAQMGLSATDMQEAWELVADLLAADEGTEEGEQGLGIGQGLAVGALLDRFGGEGNLNDLLKKKMTEALARQLNLDPERAATFVETLFDMLGKSKRRRGRKTTSRSTTKTTRSAGSTRSSTKSKTTGAAPKSKSTGATTKPKSTGAAKATRSKTGSTSTGAAPKSKSTGATTTTKSTGATKATRSTTGS